MFEENIKPISKPKWFIFINSSFFIWFMSSIVIGFATFGYSTWHEKYIYKKNQEEKIKRIDMEIVSRLEFFRQQRSAGLKTEEAILVLERPGASKFPSGVFTDFHKRSLRSLLIELHSIVNKEEKKEIEEAKKGSMMLGSLYISLAHKNTTKGILMSPDRLNKLVEMNEICIENFNLKRWKYPFKSYVKMNKK